MNLIHLEKKFLFEIHDRIIDLMKCFKDYKASESKVEP